MDQMVAHTGTSLRQACFFFGAKLVYLHRAGIDTGDLPIERWIELFKRFDEQPVLWQAWEPIVRFLAAEPHRTVSSILEESDWGVEPKNWRERLDDLVAAAASQAFSRDPERLLRLAAGKAMKPLRGRVPAAEVIAELKVRIGDRL